MPPAYDKGERVFSRRIFGEREPGRVREDWHEKTENMEELHLRDTVLQAGTEPEVAQIAEDIRRSVPGAQPGRTLWKKIEGNGRNRGRK